jgi:hypothetical protein
LTHLICNSRLHGSVSQCIAVNAAQDRHHILLLLLLLCTPGLLPACVMRLRLLRSWLLLLWLRMAEVQPGVCDPQFLKLLLYGG